MINLIYIFQFTVYNVVIIEIHLKKGSFIPSNKHKCILTIEMSLISPKISAQILAPNAKFRKWSVRARRQRKGGPLVNGVGGGKESRFYVRHRTGIRNVLGNMVSVYRERVATGFYCHSSNRVDSYILL